MKQLEEGSGGGVGGVKRTLKDLFAGAAGGVAQVLLGQPFDIVKVRLQTTQQYSSALDAATQIFKNEGPAAFYKGTLTPLVGIGACVSIQFGAFHWARRQFSALKPPGSSLSYSQYYASGAFAGIANSAVSGPIEHIRIRLQTQPHGAARLYTGPIDCIRKIAAQAGASATRNLYRGQLVTVMREATAYGAWFWAFEWMMNADVARSNDKINPLTEKPKRREDISQWRVALYGGLAGECLWLASYPFDVVKSKMQSDGFGPAAMKYAGMTDCVRKTWRAEGWRGFWRGIGPTLVRAMPVSAGTFAV